MARRPRRPARFSTVFPWTIPEVAPHAVEPRRHRSRRIITVALPFVRFPLAADARVGPLVLTIRTRDREEWTEAIAHNPTSVGTLFLDQLIAMDALRPRGRHARRAMSGRTLRICATEVYLTLEQWAQQDLRAGLEAFQRHAQARGNDCGRLMERGGRWNLRLITAYIVEVGYPEAFDKAEPPTTDPKAFYRTYIQHRDLATLRVALGRTPSPRASALLASVIAEAPPPPRPPGAAVPPGS
jgi:hypothetical protein